MPDRADRLALQVTAQVRHLLTTCPACAERDEMKRQARAGLPRLTARRLQVLQLAADGLSITQIASRLNVTESTAKTHLQWLHAAFGVASNTLMVATALRAGVID